MNPAGKREGVDLVCIGGSLGSLVAALGVAAGGGRAVILESTKEIGGGAGVEQEAIAAAGTSQQRAAGVDDGPEHLAEDIRSATHHHAEVGIVDALARESAGLVAWLQATAGVDLELLGAPLGHSRRRLHVTGGGGAALIAGLSRAVTKNPRIAVRTGCKVDELLRDETGAVTGALVKPPRRAAETFHGNVLLACGGFAANDALVAEHGAAVAGLPYHGNPHATGEALRLAAPLGAATCRMSSFAVTPLLALPGPFAVSQLVVEQGGILVNQLGRRFVDETDERLVVANALRAQPGRLAYLLFDERSASEARSADPFLARVVLPRTGRRADRLEDLAKQFELNVENLLLTIDTYNGNLELGGDPFGRDTATVRLAPPFHAIRVTAARRFTLGGLTVDTNAAVCDGNGRPLRGLYAAGGAAAGLGGEGTEGSLVGTLALSAAGLARLAARDVLALRAPAPAEAEPVA